LLILFEKKQSSHAFCFGFRDVGRQPRSLLGLHFSLEISTHGTPSLSSFIHFGSMRHFYVLSHFDLLMPRLGRLVSKWSDSAAPEIQKLADSWHPDLSTCPFPLNTVETVEDYINLCLIGEFLEVTWLNMTRSIQSLGLLRICIKWPTHIHTLLNVRLAFNSVWVKSTRYTLWFVLVL
jgi:hypothetical protein